MWPGGWVVGCCSPTGRISKFISKTAVGANRYIQPKTLLIGSPAILDQRHRTGECDRSCACRINSKNPFGGQKCTPRLARGLPTCCAVQGSRMPPRVPCGEVILQQEDKVLLGPPYTAHQNKEQIIHHSSWSLVQNLNFKLQKSNSFVAG